MTAPTNARGLVLVRSVHTLIYVVMSLSTLLLLYIGISGHLMVLLWGVVPLLTVEVVVFAASGMKCPLTAVVNRYSGGALHVADTYLPEAFTRHTLAMFGPVLPIACTLLAARAAGIIGSGP